jgi:Zn-finger nucleic acid-binding protein
MRHKRAKHIEIYTDNHKRCPNCDGTWLNQTLVGYVFNVAKPEEYKDENRATCLACGWVGIVHDMKPL